MDLKLLIGGALVDGAGKMPVINPATAETIVDAPRGDAAQMEQAIASARQAFSGWSEKPIKDRQGVLSALADAIEADADAFARLLTQEQGKPLPQAQGEILGCVGTLRYYAQLDLPLRVIRENEQERIVEQRLPLGVVGAIVPWNFPMLLAMLKLAPALLAGNTVVLKPAPTTPLTALKLAALATSIVPAGVLNVVTDANDLGGLLTAHPDVAKVAFTGSTATGRKVMASAAGTIKRVTLELGGNDAAIVLDDVSPKVAAQRLFDGATANAGQICLAIKRAYVPRSLYDEICDELSVLAQDAVVDDGLKQGTQIGPVQNRAQFEKVLGFIDRAKKEGKIVAGGAAMDRAGFFIQPTIVRDMADDAEIVREEQFGPVLPVLAYDDIDDVISRANNSEYGLGGTVWTGDIERGFDVARRIEAGTVWVNKHMDLPVDVPFGGAKQSGRGAEFGVEGLLEYTQLKIINMAMAL